MNARDIWKHTIVVILAAGAVVGGSALLGVAIDDPEGDDVGIRSFLATLGSALTLFGIASAVASITTYLVHPR